jgi:hypothetical protein
VPDRGGSLSGVARPGITVGVADHQDPAIDYLKRARAELRSPFARPTIMKRSDLMTTIAPSPVTGDPARPTPDDSSPHRGHSRPTCRGAAPEDGALAASRSRASSRGSSSTGLNRDGRQIFKILNRHSAALPPAALWAAASFEARALRGELTPTALDGLVPTW